MIRTHGVTHFDPSDCFGCRLTTIRFGRPAFEPHFNWAVGQYVRNESEFKEALKACAEANSIATGTDHHYEPRDMREVEPFNDHESTQAIENRQKAIRDRSTAHLIPKEPADV